MSTNALQHENQKREAIRLSGCHRLKSIAVIGGFLDGARLDLADGLNCVIGARGTGKTTALELVRYAMDALHSADADAADRRRTESLVQRNLAGGQIELEIETKEGLAYIITRGWGEDPMVLTADRKPTDLTLRSGDVFRADIFSQNEVERIADQTGMQLELLDAFEAEAIAEVNAQLGQLRNGTSAAAKARKIAEQHSDQLAGATVHEMRGILTPLKASVASMGQQLEHEPLDRADLRRQVGRAAGRIVFLERLIEDMHCYAQPVPGQRRRERLRDVIDEAVGMAQESLSAAGRDPRRVSVEVGVETHIAPGVSRYHVVAAIANVVKNAIESYATGSKSFRKGKVAVSARTANTDQVEIVIADDGCGISPTDLEEIRQFIPGKTTKKNLGTGFGLPIAKRNILAHGGDLSIVSREGEGTVITIVLPLEQDQGDEP